MSEGPPERPRDPRDHIWHTAAPRPASAVPSAGKRILAVVFIALLLVILIVALVLIATGTVSTDASVPGE